MSNIVSLRLPRRMDLPQRVSGLLHSFAGHRRGAEDVFWLKENAEALNILETTRTPLSEDALQSYADVYEGMAERLRFFPQYYRFLLSICLDLEDLGLSGGTGEALCDWVRACGLADAELSDLQRAEAQRLLARRGEGAADPALEARLRAFMARSETFALPNKKAAYELTHIVFYLSEYGRRDPALDADAVCSLEFAGLLAYLDQNADLLAEVCIAIRFAGQTPSVIWENWLQAGLSGFILSEAPGDSLNDAYHDYLVNNWWARVAGFPAFEDVMPGGKIVFSRRAAAPGPLRAMSETMFGLGTARSRDWARMRPHIEGALEAQAHCILSDAELSSARFGEFFGGFARAGGHV